MVSWDFLGGLRWEDDDPAGCFKQASPVSYDCEKQPYTSRTFERRASG
jgi:hypothetical protein